MKHSSHSASPHHDMKHAHQNDSADEVHESVSKEQRDMSHVESMLDSLDSDELAHAHEHLKKKMEPSLNNPDDELGGEVKYDDFMSAKANQD